MTTPSCAKPVVRYNLGFMAGFDASPLRGWPLRLNLPYPIRADTYWVQGFVAGAMAPVRDFVGEWHPWPPCPEGRKP